MDKNMKQTRAARAKAEEATLNRVLCWITGGSVLEFLLLLLNRYWSNYNPSMLPLKVVYISLKVLAVGALLCAAAALFWWYNARKAKKGAMLPAVLGLFMLGVSVSGFVFWFFLLPGLQLMYVAVPVVVLMALIYYLYQKEFFLIACQSVLALLCVWGSSRGHGPLLYGCVILCALLTLASVGLSRKAQEENGVIEIKKEKRRLFPKDANYALIYLGAIIALLVMILSAIGLAPMALYAVVAAWLLIMAVYYTVKLM